MLKNKLIKDALFEFTHSKTKKIVIQVVATKKQVCIAIFQQYK